MPTERWAQGKSGYGLTRIQFDDQRFVDVVSDFVTVRGSLVSAFELLRIDGNPRWETGLLSQRQRFSDTHLLLGLFANGNNVACLDLVRSDVHDDTVNSQRLVGHQLTRFSASRAEAHTINDVVQTRFQQLQQCFAGVALATVRFSEVATELALEHAVDTLDLLLFAQLVAVVRSASTRSATVLTWLGIQFALGIQRAACALQEQVGAFAAGKFCFWSDITCHGISFIKRRSKTIAGLNASLICVLSNSGLKNKTRQGHWRVISDTFAYSAKAQDYTTD